MKPALLQCHVSPCGLKPRPAAALQSENRRLPRRTRPCGAQPAARLAAPTATELEHAVVVLHKAAETAMVPPKEVFAAMRTLERGSPKAPAELKDWPQILGGSASPGRRWRLVFTTGTKEVADALKGVGAGGGSYFPLTAVQRWDASSGEIENGIFLGRILQLTFKGPYSFEGKILAFDFDTLTLRLGPATWAILLKAALPRAPGAYKRVKSSPFFSFFYIDERIAAARGRGGGIAVWARTSPAWELKSGIV